MTEENQQAQDDEQNELPPSTPPVANNEGDKKINSEGSGKDSAKECHPGLQIPQPFIVKEEKEKKRGLKTSEIISFIALMVSIYAVLLNKCSVDNTTRALAITDSTFQRNIIKDSLTAISNIIKDSLDSITRQNDFVKDSTNTDLNRQSLQAQINSIKEGQRQFKKQNEPYLQIRGDIQLTFPNNGHKAIVKYVLTNLTNSPANVIDKTAWWGLDMFAPPFFPTKNGTEIYMPIKGYIIKESYLDTKTEYPKELTRTQKIAVELGMMNVYYYTEIRYKSEITGTNRTYRCGIKLALRKDGTTYSEFLFNENF